MSRASPLLHVGSATLRPPRAPLASDRFQPHASGAMASMFDDVSGRYDILNRLMTLGQDGAWRQAMWREVPAESRVVLDLCTGSGVSLPGLRRPGRLVLGVDVSFAMLEVARDEHGGPGWAPRIVCADAFRVPVRDGSLDAVTVAFGIRNLRPRRAALGEIARTLRPGATLIVLEAAAPAPGPLRPLHTMWLRHAVPLLGLLSPDPSAYRYLRDSIFDFGDGSAFEGDLAQAGFQVTRRRSFLLGATRLWVARRAGGIGQNPLTHEAAVHSARPDRGERPPARPAPAVPGADGRTWQGFQALVAVALAAGLAWALLAWAKVNEDMPLSSFQRVAGWLLLGAGLVVFSARAVWMSLRYLAGGQGR